MTKRSFLFYFIICFLSFLVRANDDVEVIPVKLIDEKVPTLMEEGDIPGLSLVVIKDGSLVIKNYGYADIDLNRKVDRETLFQLGSCSKAFTGLAVLNLLNENQIDLNNNVSDYIPWFKVYYKDSLVNIKLKHLLHHTSGIPWYSISLIPQSNDEHSLKNTIEIINKINLHLIGK